MSMSILHIYYGYDQSVNCGKICFFSSNLLSDVMIPT